MKPVGPEDPKIYWRRRALAIGVVVVVLLLLMLLMRSCGGGEPAPAPSATADSTGQPTATASPSPSPSPAASESAAAGVAAADAGTCSDSDITVTVEPDQQAYPAGTIPQITLTIQNTGSESCTRNIGSIANSLEISSGGVRVWSSDDCDDNGSTDVQNLDPQKIATVTVPWPRTVSAEGCPVPPGEQVSAQPGFYDVVGKNLDVKSKKVSFSLQ